MAPPIPSGPTLPARPALSYLMVKEAKTALVGPTGHRRESGMREIGHFIGGQEVKGRSGRAGDVFNPNTGEVQAKVAFASKSEVEQAIANAEAAQPAWAATNPQRRARRPPRHARVDPSAAALKEP